MESLGEIAVNLESAFAPYSSASLSEKISMICDLVSVHARSRHLDGTFPVVVHVTQLVSELMQVILGDVTIVSGDEVVNRVSATLSDFLRSYEEIMLLVLFFLLSVLNNVRLNNCT